MGAKLTVIENRSNNDMEIRVWVPPARPDKFQRIMRIEAKGWKEINSKNFSFGNLSPDEGFMSTLLMIYVDGVYTGNYFLPTHLRKYAKVICDINEEGHYVIQGIKPTFDFCRFKF
ncbi:uncharacterized protein LOC132029791 [Lycium ferocissimum]|uniref:uncharacterized protein LOC132029791 n=1 Tax=Lycium ferocissimum TaxID=112874 RepID=UPI002814CF9E|nr:uncharacterized protein LOC132029791 [Lycium ferocissimum]